MHYHSFVDVTDFIDISCHSGVSFIKNSFNRNMSLTKIFTQKFSFCLTKNSEIHQKITTRHACFTPLALRPGHTSHGFCYFPRESHQGNGKAQQIAMPSCRLCVMVSLVWSSLGQVSQLSIYSMLRYNISETKMYIEYGYHIKVLKRKQLFCKSQRLAIVH